MRKLLWLFLFIPIAFGQQASAPEPAKAEPTADALPTGSVELGYRFIPTLNGSIPTYRSIVNLGEGPRILVARKGRDVAILPENTYWWNDRSGWVKRERTPFDSLNSSVIVSSYSVRIERPVTGPSVDTERRTVYYSNRSIRHKERWRLRDLVTLVDPATAGGVRVQYYLHANNLPEPIEGWLDVSFQRGLAETVSPATEGA